MRRPHLARSPLPPSSPRNPSQWPLSKSNRPPSRRPSRRQRDQQHGRRKHRRGAAPGPLVAKAGCQCIADSYNLAVVRIRTACTNLSMHPASVRSISGWRRKLSGATPTPATSDGTTAPQRTSKANGKADELSPTAHPKTPQPQNELVGRRVKVPAGLHAHTFVLSIILGEVLWQPPIACCHCQLILQSSGCRHRE